jgi:hypothetical protein
MSGSSLGLASKHHSTECHRVNIFTAYKTHAVLGSPQLAQGVQRQRFSMSRRRLSPPSECDSRCKGWYSECRHNAFTAGTERRAALWLLGSVYWCPLRRKLKAHLLQKCGRLRAVLLCERANLRARSGWYARSAAAAPFFPFYAADNKSSGRLRMWGVSAPEHFFSLCLGIFEVRFFNDSQSKGTAMLLQKTR